MYEENKEVYIQKSVTDWWRKIISSRKPKKLCQRSTLKNSNNIREEKDHIHLFLCASKYTFKI